MRPLKDLINRIRQEERLPVINPDRCVHSLVEVASCSACVDVCPAQAWSLDDEALQFDASLCNGCGLCVPVCPESAVTVQYEILIGDLGEGKIALCACEQTGMEDNQGVLPCINLIGLSDILKLYRQGHLHWVSATGSCPECPHGSSTTLFERIQEINSALVEEELPLIEYHKLSFKQWRRVQSRMDVNPVTSNLSRRSFLRDVMGSGVETASTLFKLNEQAANVFPSPGELLPNGKKSSTWPYVPQINSNRCDGCDACVKTCPHNAIALITEPNKTFYEIRPEACTACAICRDICEKEAITILKWSRMPQKSLTLNTFTCTRCGNIAHPPSEAPQQLCRICAQVNHHSNLYQVMD